MTTTTLHRCRAAAARAALGLALLTALSGCGADAPVAQAPDAPAGPTTAAAADATVPAVEPAAPDEGGAAAPSRTAARFTAIQDEAGLDFRHDNGASGRKYMVETLGAGGGMLDYDDDGDPDLYLVQGGPLPGSEDMTPRSDRLYRNDGQGRFTDVTEAAGLGDTGYGMGVCFGDVDNDGRVDIHVANFGQDSLWRNVGDGTFQEVGEAAGIDNPLWASSCGFADYDRDGWLDLFVVNYVDHSLENNKACGPPGQLMYCHPDVYGGVPDVLYRNLGEGRFEKVTAEAGVLDDDPAQGKGLGVSWLDFDDDGWIDLYVANDSTRQFLYRNRGDGTFEESGVLRGVAYNAEGKTEAGMGVAVGDVDGDGLLDIYMTTLDVETNTLQRNGEGYFFEDVTERSGAGEDPEQRVGFGTEMLDVEQDGDLDIYVTNGHIIDNIELVNPRLTFEQRDQLYENLGEGRFADVSALAGEAFQTLGVGRATASGDIDGDGDLDLLITHNGRPAVLLRNDSEPMGASLILDLRSRHGGRPAIGARAIVRAGDRTWLRELRAGGSYQGQRDARLHVGLGDAEAVDEVVIRWPEGDTQTIEGATLRLDGVNRIDQAPAP